MFPKKLQNINEDRKAKNALRYLSSSKTNIDFSSNDYLGFSRSEYMYTQSQEYLKSQKLQLNGSTGSRLLSGNHSLYSITETEISNFHQVESSLIFNSGYDANLGFFSCIPQRGDIVFYDELIHASIRDGLKMCSAKHYKFAHNNLNDLEVQIQRQKEKWSKSESSSCIYIVTESVFSMDGDSPDLKTLVAISKKYKSYLVVDEAHAVGVLGQYGHGLVEQLNLQNNIFARIVTFGKALGCHGAAILGSKQLTDFLVNFSRPFIYTTALPPHSLASIKMSYQALTHENQTEDASLEQLQSNIRFFKNELKRLGLNHQFIESQSAIQCCLVTGNTHVKGISEKLKAKGFDVKAILSPTVPEHKERLRFCLHAYNTKKEISEVLFLLSTFVDNHYKV